MWDRRSHQHQQNFILGKTSISIQFPVLKEVNNTNCTPDTSLFRCLKIFVFIFLYFKQQSLLSLCWETSYHHLCWIEKQNSTLEINIFTPTWKLSSAERCSKVALHELLTFCVCESSGQVLHTVGHKPRLRKYLQFTSSPTTDHSMSFPAISFVPLSQFVFMCFIRTHLLLSDLPDIQNRISQNIPQSENPVKHQISNKHLSQSVSGVFCWVWVC